LNRELWFEAPFQVALRSVQSADVVARALFSCVSVGTELLLYKGEGPATFDPSLAATTYPCRYGYAWVGRRIADGATVFALAPHGEVLRAGEASMRLIPPEIPPPRACLAANLETAIALAWDAAPVFGERVVVFGGGVVGLLAVYILRRMGVAVHLVEPSASRRAYAEAWGATASASLEAEACFDAALEVTGNPAVLDDTIAAVVPEGRVVVGSFYGARRAPIGLGERFHRDRLSLRSSCVSTLPGALRGRFDYDRRFALVLETLQDARLDALLGTPVPFEEAPRLYEALANGQRSLANAPAPLFSYPC
jgi:threonine dehydrogenase-like Zn-dependent dehydrogenase